MEHLIKFIDNNEKAYDAIIGQLREKRQNEYYKSLGISSPSAMNKEQKAKAILNALDPLNKKQHAGLEILIKKTEATQSEIEKEILELFKQEKLPISKNNVKLFYYYVYKVFKEVASGNEQTEIKQIRNNQNKLNKTQNDIMKALQESAIFGVFLHELSEKNIKDKSTSDFGKYVTSSTNGAIKRVKKTMGWEEALKGIHENKMKLDSPEMIKGLESMFLNKLDQTSNPYVSKFSKGAHFIAENIPPEQQEEILKNLTSTNYKIKFKQVADAFHSNDKVGSGDVEVSSLPLSTIREGTIKSKFSKGLDFGRNVVVSGSVLPNYLKESITGIQNVIKGLGPYGLIGSVLGDVLKLDISASDWALRKAGKLAGVKNAETVGK
jgi:hypothetical protein